MRVDAPATPESRLPPTPPRSVTTGAPRRKSPSNVRTPAIFPARGCSTLTQTSANPRKPRNRALRASVVTRLSQGRTPICPYRPRSGRPAERRWTTSGLDPLIRAVQLSEPAQIVPRSCRPRRRCARDLSVFARPPPPRPDRFCGIPLIDVIFWWRKQQSAWLDRWCRAVRERRRMVRAMSTSCFHFPFPRGHTLIVCPVDGNVESGHSTWIFHGRAWNVENGKMEEREKSPLKNYCNFPVDTTSTNMIQCGRRPE